MSRAVRALMVRDLRVVLRSRAVWIPLLVVPAVVFVLLPMGVALGAGFAGASLAREMDELRAFLEALPAPLRADLAARPEEARMVVLVLGYLLAPMFLVVPLMVASVIAADAFAGEKERGTLEALLHTPVREAELFAGKLLAAWLPAVAVSWAGTVLYAVVATAAAWPLTGGAFLPAAVWLPLALWVAPAVALASLGTTVLISARVSSYQEAYQLGGVVVVPIVALVVAQAAGVVVLDARLLLGLGAVVWLLDGLLLAWALRGFTRARLLGIA